MELKHTPGPWQIDDCYEADLLNENPPRRETVWEITNRDFGNSPAYATSKADASLIAAAPELLEVLRTILDVYDQHKIIGGTTYHDARAAIAKAEGRS